MSDQRRLAAILAADMVGYSRLMESDESGTLARLKTHRIELVDPAIAKNSGRIVKTTGDGMLVEFASVVDAVQCAVEIQRRMARRNADVPADRHIEFRIGINLGDIIVEEEDVYGGGVNIAARLEALAEPGGICISGTAYDHLTTQIDVGYEDLGEQEVKNISSPVRAYRVLLDAGNGAGIPVSPRPPARNRQWIAAAAALVVVLVSAGGYLGWDYERQSEVAEQMTPSETVFHVPDMPTVAVLAFENLSGDPEQEYFSDGLSEDIITTLSNLFGVLVVARNSSFQYRDRSIDVRQIASDLGVDFVLEGSVQRSGDDLRISAQLIDGDTGQHVWSERYDRPFDDVFSIRDDIIKNITTALSINIARGEAARDFGRTTSAQSYDYYLRAQQHFYNRTKEDIEIAIELYGRVVSLDPNYTHAWLMLGWSHRMTASDSLIEDRAAGYARAIEMAERALAIDPDFGPAYSLLGDVAGRISEDRTQAQALAYLEKAVELRPNDHGARGILGFGYIYARRLDDALRTLKAAMRLSPYPLDFVVFHLGHANLLTGNVDEAIQIWNALLARGTASAVWEARTNTFLALAYMAQGQEERARAEIAAASEVYPRMSIAAQKVFFNRHDPSILDPWSDTWRRLGMPE